MYQTPDDLFADILLRAYPKGWSGGVKSDFQIIDSPSDVNIIQLPQSNNDVQRYIAQLNKMACIGRSEIGNDSGVECTSNRQTIEVADRYFDAERIERLVSAGIPDDGISDVFIRSVELGAIIGSYLIEKSPRMKWLPMYPYWESPIFDEVTLTIYNVFHWAVKRFTMYGINDDMLAKCDACLSMIDE